MIFITLGSQKFQFNRLLKKVDELIDSGLICEEVFAQIGASDYIPKKYSYEKFIDRDVFNERLNNCDIVITHGGTGVIISAVKKHKKVIAVPRLREFGEHVDDHQLQLLKQFEELNIICSCYDIELLGDCYKEVLKKQYNEYISNTDTIINAIDDYIQNLYIGK